MGKKTDRKEELEKAERKVERAKLKLEVAQAKQVQARERGKQEIERARLQAAEWQAIATERVEERARKLETAEQRVRELISHGNATPELLDVNVEQVPATPESVADSLERQEAEHETGGEAQVMLSSPLGFAHGDGRA